MQDKAVIQEIYVYLIIIIFKIENLLFVSQKSLEVNTLSQGCFFIERGVDFCFLLGPEEEELWNILAKKSSPAVST